MAECVLTTSTCLPPTWLVSNILRSDNILIEQHENYQKRSFRNRVYIAGANGIQLLTIPLVKGKNQGVRITDVRIAYDEDWATEWISKLQNAYSNAPFYIYYVDAIADILRKKHETLWKLNMDFYHWTTQVLDINIELGFTISYLKSYEPEVKDLRNTMNPKELKPPPSTRPYSQVYESKHGFIPNLSILDLLMCAGPEAKYYL